MLSKIKRNNEKGFTLIELMIVIAIIGILAAIAIPQFSAYRKRAGDSAAKADLRNAATAQELYFQEYNTYADDETKLTGTTFGFSKSKDVDFDIDEGDKENYKMRAKHALSDHTFYLKGPGGAITTTAY